MLSRHTKIIKLSKDKYAIFNNLLMNIAIITEEEKKNIIQEKNLSSKEIKELYKMGIYIKDSSKDDEAEKIMQEIYNSQCGIIDVMYLILTNNCNLRCSYCFLENNINCPANRSNMTEDVALCALKKYEEHLKTKKISEGTLLLYGGEPLLNKKILRTITNFCKNSRIKFNLNLVTNGTLLTDSMIDFLKENDIKISISIDGPEDITNKNRKFRNSSVGVYNDVIDKIKKLQKKKVNFGLSLVITDYFLENQDKVLNWILKNHNGSIFYNLFHFDKPNKNIPDFSKKSAKFITNSYNYFINSNEKIYDTRIQRQINSYVKNNFIFSDCAAIGFKQLTILPNGDLCVCHGDSSNKKNHIGNIFTFDFSKIPEIEQYNFWKYKSTLYNQKCLNCEALFICGGGCAHHAEATTNDRNNIDESYCIYAKEILNWMLKKSDIKMIEEDIIRGGEKYEKIEYQKNI